MRLAFKTSNQLTTWENVLAVWREADQIEAFESGWNFDHFYPIGEGADPAQPCLEGWTMLAALAQATGRLRLGTMVTGIHYRHPAVLANIVSTLDIVSNGRLELGIGAGWNEQESGAYGIELGSLKERHDRFDEACEVLVGLLTQDSTDFAGEYYTLTDARNEPKGPQRPHPPFVIGGGGEKRTLRTVARYAQHWNFPGGTPAELAHKRDVLHQHCADVGRDPAEIMISMHVRTPASPTASDLAKAVEEAAALEQEGLQLAVVYLAPPHTPAVLEPIATAFAQLARTHAPDVNAGHANL